MVVVKRSDGTERMVLVVIVLKHMTDSGGSYCWCVMGLQDGLVQWY